MLLVACRLDATGATGRERESSKWVVGWGKKCQQSSSLSQLKDEAAAQDTSVLAETLSGPSTPSSPKSVSPSSPAFPSWYELRARPPDALERAASCCGGEGRRGRGALVSRDHSQEGRSQQTRAARANAQTFQEVALLSLALRFAWPTSPSPQPQQEIIAGSHPTFGRHLRTVLVLVLPPACQSASTDPLFLTHPGLTVHLARSQPHLYF